MTKIDISIAFDNAEYLTPQVYLYIHSLKNVIPDDSTLHVTTTRSGDSILKYISKNIRTKIYIKPPIQELKSRCSYLMRTMQVDSDADYILKTDLDILFLNNFAGIETLAKANMDMVIQSENRRIISEPELEYKLWKRIYKALGYELPDLMIPYIEGHELGRPLLNTGAFLIKNEKMKNLFDDWVNKTKICENWIQYNIHPNEFALTAKILCENWKWMGLPQWLHFNPIGHFRNGSFPSQKLIDDCKLPEDIFMLHWHKPQWLWHIAKYNKNVQDIIKPIGINIPIKWWDLPIETYMEK